MPTLGEAARVGERQLFVGREKELQRFRQWLQSEPDPPEIISVSGYGGVGKSALLGEFARISSELGYEIAPVDARNSPATPEGFATQLGESSLAVAAEKLSVTKPLLLIDTFEILEGMNTVLQEEFLASLDAGVRVVLSGRHPLTGPVWQGWGAVIRPMALEPLTAEDAREYLGRRGIKDDSLAQRVVGATQGLPLALSLGADLVTQFEATVFEKVEWSKVVGSMVETLLRDIREPDLRQILEAASLLRQFDREALEEVSGRDDAGVAFERLCRLSFVRPAEHGLMLHDEVRRFLSEELRSRDPSLVEQLKERAIAFFARRMEEADAREREWLVQEQFALRFLALEELAENFFSAGSEPGAISLQRFRPSDPAVIMGILERYRPQVPNPMAGPTPEELSEELVRGLIDYDGTLWRLARDREGRWLAYGFLLPICKDSLELLPADGVLDNLVRATLTAAEIEALPEDAGGTSAVFLSTVAASGEGDVPGAMQALARDVMGEFLQWEFLLACTASPGYKNALEAIRFARVPEAARDSGWDEPYEGFVLDRRGIAVGRWLQALTRGAPLPKRATLEELESMVRDVLIGWHEDDTVAGSGLAGVLGLPESSTERRAATIRERVHRALEESRVEELPDQILACRAIELGYLDKRLSHERAAEEMAVSRSTFYRLLARGIRAIASNIGR